jgi:hypothetical protein
VAGAEAPQLIDRTMTTWDGRERRMTFAQPVLIRAPTNPVTVSE